MKTIQETLARKKKRFQKMYYVLSNHLLPFIKTFTSGLERQTAEFITMRGLQFFSRLLSVFQGFFYLRVGLNKMSTSGTYHMS